ncbi:MAG: hypothetical protein LBG92_03090 [Prevotellaceae bacterium]|jgi:hypothetical protein|nr:hypothetical protein [Prevotellaceae bacterium]
MKGTGIQIDLDWDLLISVKKDATGKITGGLLVGKTTAQNQALIIVANKGEFKEFPAVGAGFDGAVNDENIWLWKREITEQIEADGQRIDALKISEIEFFLDAKYAEN